MSERDLRLVDPLSEVTRKERRLLLGLCVLAFFLVEANAIPSKLSVLGVELQPADQGVLVLVLAGIALYLTVVFVTYAMSDFLAWRKEIFSAEMKDLDDVFLVQMRKIPRDQFEEGLESEQGRLFKQNKIWFSLTRPVSVLRALVEFFLPVVVGIATTIYLSLHAVTGI